MIEHSLSGLPVEHVLGTMFTRPRAGVVVLGVDGEVDALTAGSMNAALDELLAEPGDSMLVVDLTDVTFLASSGLAVLIQAAKRAAARGLRLRLVADTRAIRRPLEITGVDQMFDMHTDVESACRPC